METEPADYSAHDLLRVRGPESLSGAPPPGWAAAALRATPWVVVRRALLSDNGSLPVGVRGRRRAQRHAAWLPPRDVARRVRPEELAGRGAALDPLLPAVRALATVAETFVAAGLSWGPTGSVGFELVTGARAVNASSDLDVLVRADEPLDRRVAADLLDGISGLGCRVDCLVEAPAGAFALAELVSGNAVLLRTEDGPRLVADPWLPGVGACPGNTGMPS